MIHDIIIWLYWFGTDFCVNMANLLGITYDEFNVVLFLFLLPTLLLVLIGLNIYKMISRNTGCLRVSAK